MTITETVNVGDVVVFTFAGGTHTGTVTHVYADAQMQRFTAENVDANMRYAQVASRKATVIHPAAEAA